MGSAPTRGNPVADLVLVLANVVYGTSYLAARVALDDVSPATLAFGRLLIAGLILGPFAVAAGGVRLPRGDAWRVFWMGVVGFGAAYALSHWGLSWSSVTHAALLIVVEPVALIAIAAIALGERLRRREAAGAVLTIVGAILVVADGLPGVAEGLVPTWQGDLLLVLAGVAYACYSVIGRDVLARQPVLPVTVMSILWGAAAMLPLAAAEWLANPPLRPTGSGLGAALYLGVVITGLGYVIWNWALRRVAASRAAIFLVVQPLVGVGSGVVGRHETLGPFTVLGGVLIVAGLIVTVRAAR